jgi:hypothetical protein
MYIGSCNVLTAIRRQNGTSDVPQAKEMKVYIIEMRNRKHSKVLLIPSAKAPTTRAEIYHLTYKKCSNLTTWKSHRAVLTSFHFSFSHLLLRLCLRLVPVLLSPTDSVIFQDHYRH